MFGRHQHELPGGSAKNSNWPSTLPDRNASSPRPGSPVTRPPTAWASRPGAVLLGELVDQRVHDRGHARGVGLDPRGAVDDPGGRGDGRLGEVGDLGDVVGRDGGAAVELGDGVVGLAGRDRRVLGADRHRAASRSAPRDPSPPAAPWRHGTDAARCPVTARPAVRATTAASRPPRRGPPRPAGCRRRSGHLVREQGERQQPPASGDDQPGQARHAGQACPSWPAPGRRPAARGRGEVAVAQGAVPAGDGQHQRDRPQPLVAAIRASTAVRLGRGQPVVDRQPAAVHQPGARLGQDGPHRRPPPPSKLAGLPSWSATSRASTSARTLSDSFSISCDDRRDRC